MFIPEPEVAERMVMLNDISRLCILNAALSIVGFAFCCCIDGLQGRGKHTFSLAKLTSLIVSSSPAAARVDPLGLNASCRTGIGNLVATLTKSPDGNL